MLERRQPVASATSKTSALLSQRLPLCRHSTASRSSLWLVGALVFIRVGRGHAPSGGGGGGGSAICGGVSRSLFKAFSGGRVIISVCQNKQEDLGHSEDISNFTASWRKLKSNASLIFLVAYTYFEPRQILFQPPSPVLLFTKVFRSYL